MDENMLRFLEQCIVISLPHYSQRLEQLFEEFFSIDLNQQDLRAKISMSSLKHELKSIYRCPKLGVSLFLSKYIKHRMVDN